MCLYIWDHWPRIGCKTFISGEVSYWCRLILFSCSQRLWMDTKLVHQLYSDFLLRLWVAPGIWSILLTLDTQSEILILQVTHPTKREVYLHDSIDGCWHEIQNQINEAIIACRSDKNNLQLPPLLPPPSGLEMFGFTSTSIIEVKITVCHMQ